MDIEQLKLILETLQGVGHEAGNLAVLYLWLQFVGGVLTNTSLVGIFVGLFYFIYKGIKIGTGRDVCERFLCEMRDQLRTGTGGHLTDGERHLTMNVIRALVAEKRAKGQS